MNVNDEHLCELLTVARELRLATTRLDHWHRKPCRFCDLVARLDKALAHFETSVQE